jgi:hypothetical protein
MERAPPPARRAAQPVPVIRPQPDHHDLRPIRRYPNITVLEHDVLDMEQFLP